MTGFFLEGCLGLRHLGRKPQAPSPTLVAIIRVVKATLCHDLPAMVKAKLTKPKLIFHGQRAEHLAGLNRSAYTTVAISTS
jgi:hypothetical protein